MVTSELTDRSEDQPFKLQEQVFGLDKRLTVLEGELKAMDIKMANTVDSLKAVSETCHRIEVHEEQRKSVLEGIQGAIKTLDDKVGNLKARYEEDNAEDRKIEAEEKKRREKRQDRRATIQAGITIAVCSTLIVTTGGWVLAQIWAGTVRTASEMVEETEERLEESAQ